MEIGNWEIKFVLWSIEIETHFGQKRFWIKSSIQTSKLNLTLQLFKLVHRSK